MMNTKMITYDAITVLCEYLSYRDKLRLAQLLIQQARKEEETEHPQKRVETNQHLVPKPQETSEKNKVSKEEETEHPQKRVETNQHLVPKPQETIEYITDRLLKLKSRPSKKSSLINFIKAMFQYQGGISDTDIEKIISQLQKQKYISIESNDKVTYLKS